MLLAVVTQLLKEHGSGRKYGPLATITNICACSVIFSLVEVLKTLGCRLLSLRALSAKIFTVLRVRLATRRIRASAHLVVVSTAQPVPRLPLGIRNAHLRCISSASRRVSEPCARGTSQQPGKSALTAVRVLREHGVQDAIEKEQALQKVLSRIPLDSSSAGSVRHAAIAQAMHVPPWSVERYLAKLRASSLTMSSRNLSLTAQITRLIKQARTLCVWLCT